MKNNSRATTLHTAVVIALSGLFLTACGGGGSHSDSVTPPGSVSPSGLSYSTPPAFSTGQSIQPLSPKVTGTVSHYSVAPQLPDGMTLDATTGVISGTPTTVTGSASYTVTASNSGGSTTAVIVIAVNDRQPVVYYPQNRLALNVGTQIPTDTPLSMGGGVTSWAISPALPAGLAFSTTKGTITGTPSAESPTLTYKVTATNSGGATTTSVNIAVGGLNLPDLGHVAQMAVIRFDGGGQHAFSMDISGHWTLWNYSSGALLANGDSQCTGDTCKSTQSCTVMRADCPNDLPADLRGSTIAVQIPAGFALLSATDGQAIGAVAVPDTPAWWQLASDGSYVVVGSSSGLYAWSAAGSTAGRLLYSKAGNYYGAAAFAAPGEIRVASGPAGKNVVETVTLASGKSAVGPAFQGTFQSWFVDGARFLTAVSNSVLTYSAAGAQQDATTLQSATKLNGSGNYFWQVADHAVNIFKVGASSSPALSMSFTLPPQVVAASGSVLGVVPDDPVPSAPQISIVDLSGASPVKTDQPILPSKSISAFALKSASSWLAGNVRGVLLDNTARQLNLGAAIDIAGSPSRFAVSTSVGKILYFDTTTGTQQGTVAKFSDQLQMSSDGSVLAALGDNPYIGQLVPDQTVKVYSLPSNSVIGTFADPNFVALNIVLSANGTTLGQVAGSNRNFTRKTTSATGGAVTWSDSVTSDNDVWTLPILLSPDGTYVAAPAANALTPTGGTNIFHNGTLVTAVTGFAVGWLDNNRLLVNTYKSTSLFGGIGYDTSIIYDATGQKVSTIKLPVDAQAMQPVSSDSILVRGRVSQLSQPSIVSTSTGTVLLSVGEASPSAIAGPRLVYVSGSRLMAVKY